MKILILGGGAFGTAIANQLSFNTQNDVTLLVRDQNKVAEINTHNTNKKYFPNKLLSPRLNATKDYSMVKYSEVIFIALPAKAILMEVCNIKKYLKPTTLLVNLSKGIFKEGSTIVETLIQTLEHNNIVTMKGASFAGEMMDRSPTLLTLGFDSKHQYNTINSLLQKTYIYIDYTTDVRGVELLSAIKNIYAILLGNVDAQYNSSNTRFMILTKAFSETRIILKTLGGKEETLFLSAGFGDLGLTSLNDLSRNRTLGLLIGKGFYNSDFETNSVVIEGIKTLEMIDSLLSDVLKRRLPIFNKIVSFFRNKEKNIEIIFEELMKSNYKTVITYGTFDLFHYGHVEILRRARALGDRLIVGLSTDEFNLTKGKKCEISYDKRKQLLESIEYVDLVIPEENWNQKINDIQKNDVDIFVMGDDWKGKFDFLNQYCEVHYFPRTFGISTTKLKSILNTKD